MSRVDLPLIRQRDHKPVGTLTIIRTNHASLVDEKGKRRPSPVVMDHLLISLKDAKGEEVTALAVPMERSSGGHAMTEIVMPTVRPPLLRSCQAMCGTREGRTMSDQTDQPGENITADELARKVADIFRRQTQPLLEQIASLERGQEELEARLAELERREREDRRP